MKDVLLQEAIKLNKLRKRRNLWKRFVSGMAVVVVFCTTYALILPAITMEQKTVCGMEAHDHSETCYEIPTGYLLNCGERLAASNVIHTHSALCRDEAGMLICPLEEIFAHTHSDACYAEAKTCELTEQEAHAHIEECYTIKEVPVCNLEEKESHTHNDLCYGEPHLTCLKEETEGHTHSDQCYGQPRLICQTEETAGHTHQDGCYQVETVIVCGLNPCEAHAHTEACYEIVQVCSCGLEETEDHVHGEGCFIQEHKLKCTLEETEGHSHDASCSAEQKILVCTEPEMKAHTHSDLCYEIPLICTQEEAEPHIHGEACYEKTLVCTQEETEGHTHGDACYRELICTLEETEGHTHDGNCQWGTSEKLLCQLPEIVPHAHGEACYDGAGNLTCVLTEYVEHIHDDTCLSAQEPVLICQLPVHEHEESCYPEEETYPTDPGFLCGFGRHTHSENCYDEAGVLACSIPEHTHEAACIVEDYDANADVETASDWEAMLSGVPRTGNWPADLLAVAQSQMGYTESKRNVVLQEDKTLKGYTRYGAWYGIPYGDWCAMFVSFCMHYAGIEDIPLHAGCSGWITELSARNFFRSADQYQPKPGDVIFFDWEGDGLSDHVGLVAALIPGGEGNGTQVKTIEGNAADCVMECTYSLQDPAILGYGLIPNGKRVQLTHEGSDYSVTVNFDSSAMIPADAQLAVREILQGTEEYDIYYQQAVEAVQDPSEPEMQQDITFARFFDISFLVNGQTVEPATPVQVTISYANAVEIPEDNTGVAVHFAEDGVEVLEAETNQQDSDEAGLADTFVFTQGSFSVSGTVVMNSETATRATGIDMSNASEFIIHSTAIKVLDGNGVQSNTFADGDTFRLILDDTVYNYQFSNGQPKVMYVKLNDTLQLTEFVCSDTVSNALIDAESNSFVMQIPAPTDGGNVPVHVELKGKAVNQTGGVATVSIRWNAVVSIYSSRQQFTHTDEKGTLTVVDLLGSSYSPEQYELVVEQVDSSAYTDVIKRFASEQYKRHAKDNNAVYRLYLQSKSNPSEQHPIPAPYMLKMTYAQSPVTLASIDIAAAVILNNGQASKPDNSAVSYSDGSVTALSASGQYNALNYIGVSAMGGLAEGTTGAGYSLSYNEITDAFLRDPKYDVYYNENSPIGTAGSFHIVAFDTANLGTHTNGNILAKNLNAGSNFGTNNYGQELTYVQNYLRVNANSASSADHILVIGSSNELELYDNGNRYSINGQGIDRPQNIIQDEDTDAAPFIDLTRVRAEIQQISAGLVGFDDMNLAVTAMDQKNVISLTNPDAVGIINVTPADKNIFGKSYIQLAGFESGHNGSIVINVDCTGYTQIDLPKALVVVDGVEQGTSEVVEFSNGKVLWNFVNAQGVTINTHLMTGMVIAPGATVNINQNLNGTVVADIVNVKAESHRTDFTGKIVPNQLTEEHSVTIRKIKTGYVGTTLSNAHFDLYIWDGSDWMKVNAASLVTDASGLILLTDLNENTAYKLVETQAPTGYVLMDEPYYFWVRGSSDVSAPGLQPDGFIGNAVDSGGIVYISNEPDEQVQKTQIQLEKQWDTQNDPTVKRIDISLYQISWQNGKEIERNVYRTVSLSAVLNWKYLVSDLPLTGTDDAGNAITYTYAVEEVPVTGYTASYSVDNTAGVTEGTILITNTEESQDKVYVLPETGGIGTTSYTFGGLLLAVVSLVYLYLFKYKPRREDVSQLP